MSEFFDVIPRDVATLQTEVKVQASKEHEFKLIGHQKKVRGHTLFCLNLKTGEIKVAPVQRSVTVDFRTKEPIHRDRIVVEPNCVYRQALNKKNFIKILRRERIVISRVPDLGDIIVDSKH